MATWATHQPWLGFLKHLNERVLLFCAAKRQGSIVIGRQPGQQYRPWRIWVQIEGCAAQYLDTGANPTDIECNPYLDQTTQKLRWIRAVDGGRTYQWMEADIDWGRMAISNPGVMGRIGNAPHTQCGYLYGDLNVFAVKDLISIQDRRLMKDHQMPSPVQEILRIAPVSDFPDCFIVTGRQGKNYESWLMSTQYEEPKRILDNGLDVYKCSLIFPKTEELEPMLDYGSIAQPFKLIHAKRIGPSFEDRQLVEGTWSCQL